MQAALPWLFLFALFVACWIALAPKPCAVFKKIFSRSDGQMPGKEIVGPTPLAPPFFKGDKVQFMNGEDVLASGTVLETRPNPTDAKHEFVTVKHFVQNGKKGLTSNETTVTSRKIILIERPKV